MNSVNDRPEFDEERGEETKDRPAAGNVTAWRIADIKVPDGRVARQERVLEIAASIAEIGQLQPALVKADGTLVAGLHRFRACEHLGQETIQAMVLTLDDLRIKLAEIDENLVRKQLDALERAELVHERKGLYETLHPEAARPRGGRLPKNGEVPSPFSAITASLARCTPRTVQTDVQIAAEIPQDVRDQIRHTPVADSKQELLQLARRDQETQRKLALKLADGSARHLYEADRAVRLEEAQQRVQSLPEDAENCRLLACTCQDLIAQVEPGSIDLILTDPPYGQDALSCYDELGRLGAHALAPNGSMLVMVGQMHLFEVLQTLREHLHYRWTLAYVVKSGGSPIVPTIHARINSWWKPILWLTRPGYAGDVHGDVIDSGPKTKLNHEWEQDVAGMGRMVELFSLPGQLVADPFVGSGTTGIAALRLERRFVGCDTDGDTVNLARVRLADAVTAEAA